MLKSYPSALRSARTPGTFGHGLARVASASTASSFCSVRMRRRPRGLERGQAALGALLVDVREDERVLGAGGADFLDGRQPRFLAILLDDVHHELESLARVVAHVGPHALLGEVFHGRFGEVGRELPERDDHRGRLGVAQRAVKVEEDDGGGVADGGRSRRLAGDLLGVTQRRAGHDERASGALSADEGGRLGRGREGGVGARSGDVKGV